MATKPYQWGKIFLAGGLLLVAVNGMRLDPLVRGQFYSVEDSEVIGLQSASEAYLKIQSRLKIFKGLLEDLQLLQKSAQGDPRLKDKHLSGLVFPLSELGARYFPKLCWNLELRLAKKELVNVERKMEQLEMICASVERQLEANHPDDKTKKWLSESEVMTLHQIDTLRRHLLIDKVNIKDLTEAFNRLQKIQAL